jgi:hemerythrin-like domain-containing protein
MSEPITMNKIIHGALRRDLARLDAALAALPDGDSARATQLGTAWRYFFQELDNHHHGEHDIAWPALRAVGVQQSLLDEMDAEHEALAAALKTTADAFNALVKEPSAVNAAAARTAVTALTHVADEHMRHEERDLERVCADKQDTPEIKAMGRKFAKRNVFLSGDFFAWLENGATAEEKAALRRMVPPPIIAIFKNVFGQRYRRAVAPVWR